MQDDLERRVAAEVHACLSRADVMAYLAMPDDTADNIARAIIPMVQAAERERGCEVLFALARVWEGNSLLHPGCIAAAEYMVEKAAAIRAIGAKP